MDLLKQLLAMLTLQSGKKTYAFSLLTACVGVWLASQGNYEMAGLAIGLSGMGAGLRNAIDKAPPSP